MQCSAGNPFISMQIRSFPCVQVPEILIESLSESNQCFVLLCHLEWTWAANKLSISSES